MSDGYGRKEVANGNATKRDVLRSIASFGLGSVAVTGIAAADDKENSQENHIHEVSNERKEHFINEITKSKQYGSVEKMIVEGDFIPQFEEGVVYEVDEKHERFDDSGLVAHIPTDNKQDDSLSVDISGYSVSGDASELELWVRASNEDRPLGTLYTSDEILREEEKGYIARFPGSSDYPSDSPQPQINIPGWSDIREAAESVIDSGKEIISNTADTFTETADYLTDEASDWAEEAYEQSEPIIENVDLDPTPERKPPEDLKDEMNNIDAEYSFTVDLQRACAYGGALTIGGGIGITLTGVGAGAGTLAIVGGGVVATVASCTVTELVNAFKEDTSCTFRYAYVFEETNTRGDTEYWYIAVPCE
ncbi:hypothetical protein [Halopiger djelfimassiliensis]|uniref:hypothetical protein n=1 Tax=Halopiger djelfimassiliensis TaxID=1293047 RepID=UPI0012B54026|nr:hypothetical protein [Halopiger djelfimassiliensis]